MTILIANIGTSDLAVKPKGIDYYLPIGFDRNEPNEDRTGLTSDEEELWNSRDQYVAELLCQDELKIPVQKTSRGEKTFFQFSFRDLTEKILEAYRANPAEWKNRLCPGRIGGVLLEAKDKYGVTDVHIFVTNQQPPQPGDSFHLFDILALWVKQKNWGLNLHPIYLDAKKAANDPDSMLDEYYRFFRTLPADAEILVSVKGGTPQMTTALKVQTFAATVRQHLFLEPILNIKTLLAGDYSSCKTASYWQYRRSQKYQTVQLLLKRWDFDGARQVLSDWQVTVKDLRKSGVVEVVEGDISQHEAVINSANAALNMAVGYLNLDKVYADSQTVPPELATLKTSYNHLLNLYAQCCLFWQVDRIADFLTRMGSFYEETLHELIRELGGEQYFDRNQYPDDWYLDTGKLLANRALLDNFYDLEQKINETFRNWTRINPMHRLYKFQGRLTKLNFVQALVKTSGDNLEAWETLVAAMEKLDYWAEKRNQLIHSAKGVSQQRMQEAGEEDYQLWRDRRMNNRNIARTVDRACLPEQILAQMAIIARSALTLMGTSSPDYFNPEAEPHYLYSKIRKWVIDTLNKDI